MSSEQPPIVAEPFDPIPVLAAELGLSPSSVAAVVRLMSEGATVPFIARYRKEATGGLDEVQIRTLAERFEYVTELEARRNHVIEEIQKQGKLSPELLGKLRTVTTKAELEDLYLPFKPKRRTRATIATERGLAPLAEQMWKQEGSGPLERAQRYVDPSKDVPDAAAALAGARDICAERLAEDAELRKRLREEFLERGVIQVKKKAEFAEQVTKFDMYANFEEPIAKVPSHRYLAIRRGENEGVLYATLNLPSEPWIPFAKSRIPVRPGSAWAAELQLVVADALDRLLLPSCASEARVELKLRSDQEAIQVFARNLGELLLAAPLGGKSVLGIDPGQRTGCKCAVVDGTGRLLEHTTLFLVQGPAALEKSKQTLLALCRTHEPDAIAVGNGTHGRETEAFVREVLGEAGLGQVPCVSVSEAGASVYSASDLAREEFPELDLTVRGAISIARRLQDPLAELVKIDPKSIGVGQYQHDVTQSALGRKLDEVVESCVNSVGVELNTASAPLLSRVSGIGPGLAKRIVAHRDTHGPFPSRKAMLKVSGLGPRTFEQAAGFLRVSGAEHPLDASAVHPERYALVERMAKDLGVALAALVGNSALVARLELDRYRSSDVGDFTLADIRAELDKPGRDPRKSFEPPQFRDDVRTLQDLVVGMDLQGVVTNITAFGAFVDIGVHQDGLVHISQLADRFVKDPHEIVKVGDRLRVRVLEVDITRKRISLTARSATPPQTASPRTAPAPVQKPAPKAAPNRSKQEARPAPTRSGADSTNAAQGFKHNPFARLLDKNK
ncbi:MAG TPA: Tex family protein [Polyangiaceae bacterium]|nr:Tex family protein [Polyangiaceae bacterium]